MNLFRGFPRKLAAGLFILVCYQVEATASDRQSQVAWSQLANEVVGRKISTVRTDGVKIEGKVTAVKPDALVVEVNKGVASVPRSQITSLRVSRPGWKWRVIGPLVGALTFGIAGGAISGRIDPTGGFGVIPSDGTAKGATVGVITGLGAGYIVGHFADRHTRVIQIME